MKQRKCNTAKIKNRSASIFTILKLKNHLPNLNFNYLLGGKVELLTLESTASGVREKDEPYSKLNYKDQGSRLDDIDEILEKIYNKLK